ncbi:ATP synthase archaeal subunit H (plasmid) [Haladaptatus sp. SPP-AMP-3]|uniref:ATP synthase archaeal subunit H n=1 Tax=Haladaptatus sp. SPP-AMP-3 TaxID=3121295 RepID=UPI003C2C71B7
MPRPEVLERIKEAETEADDIVADAKEAREERISEARTKAEDIRSEAHEEAEELEQRKLENARDDIESERKKLLAEGEEEREALETRAEENVDDAIEFVLDRFREAVHAQT